MPDKKRTGFFRKHRILILALVLILLVFTVLYFGIKKSRDFSLVFINSSVLIFFLGIVNLILTIVLLFVLGRNLIKLIIERKRGILGSKFKTKLVVAFLLIALVPSIFLFWMARDLIIKNVESWFNPPVERVLDNALDIADDYYIYTEQETKKFGQQLSKLIRKKKYLDKNRLDSLRETLKEKLKEYHLDMVSVFTSDGKPVTVLNPASLPILDFDVIPGEDLEKVLDGESFSRWNSLSKGQMFRGAYPIRSTFNRDVVGAVVVGRYVSENVTEKAMMIRDNYDDYKQLKVQKKEIKGIWIWTYGMIYFLIVFSATWIGLYLSKTITVPVMELAQGTKEISSGNLDYKVEVDAGDELGMLVDSFNEMTEELKRSKKELEETNIDLKRTNEELDKRRDYIETILENIPTGIITINSEGKIDSVNKAAGEILETGEETEGMNYESFLKKISLPEIEQTVDRLFGRVNVSLSREFDLTLNNKTKNLAVNFLSLVDSKGIYQGLIIVIEDLTELSRAKKIAAWREVARKMAHEIKNPLTPIQLSAERILKKYDREDDYADILRECVSSITEEVNSLKNLVDEFSRFAKMPSSDLKELHIEDFMENIQNLYEGRKGKLKITLNSDLPPVKADPEQIKRVFVNLIDNAFESMDNEGVVRIEGEYNTVNQMVEISVKDRGKGIDPEDRDQLFVPYFSTKEEGAGLGLAIVNRIIQDHDGRITVTENNPRGSVFTVKLPVLKRDVQ